MVKRLVELMGGRIAVESAGLSKGGAFTITVPLKLTTHQPPPAPQVPAPATKMYVSLMSIGSCVE